MMTMAFMPAFVAGLFHIIDTFIGGARIDFTINWLFTHDMAHWLFPSNYYDLTFSCSHVVPDSGTGSAASAAW